MLKKHFKISLLLCSLISQASFGQSTSSLKEGDILFQKIPCGNLCEAIIETTPCKPGRLFNHCGIVHFDNGKPCVIEAIGKAVKLTPLNDFTRRDTASILYVGRLKKKYKAAKDDASKKAIAYVGTPYDNAFLPGDSALYCSELVWKSYEQRDTPLFHLQPMTFKSPKTGQTYPAWADYYQSLKRDIPEGIPGINPCAIANDDKITLITIPK